MIDFIEKALLRVIETISIALLVVLSVSVIYSTTMRYLGMSPAWYDEIASVLLAWLSYFGASYAALMRHHMGFSGLVSALPRNLSIAIALFGEFTVIAFFAVVAWYGSLVLKVAAYDALLSLPWMSLDYVQSIIPISAMLMIICNLLTLPRTLRDVAAGIDREHEEINQAIADAEAGHDTFSSGGKRS